MSFFNGGMLPLTLSWPGLCGGVAILALTYIYLKEFFVNDPDQPAVDYKVPIPEQCQPGWRGEDLEELQLKVRDPFPFFLLHQNPQCSEADLRPTVTRLERDPMLLSSHRPFSRPREPRYVRRHQQGRCESQRGAGAVGEDKLRAEEEASADAVEVRSYGQFTVYRPRRLVCLGEGD